MTYRFHDRLKEEEAFSQMKVLLERRPTPISFPSALESQYRTSRERGRVRALLTFLQAVWVIDLLCIGLDAVVMPDQLFYCALVRIMAITPTFMCARVVIRHCRSPIIQTIALAISMLVLTVGAVYMGRLAGSIHEDRYLVAAMFAGFACTVAANIPFKHAVVYLVGSIITFMLLVFVRDAHLGVPQIVFHNIELLTYYPLAMLAGLDVRYRLEVMQRRHFLMMLREEAHSDELARQRGLNELTLQNMVQGLLMVDGHGCVQVMNDRYLELLKLPTNVRDRPWKVRDLIQLQIDRGDFGDQLQLMPAELRSEFFGNVTSARALYYERIRIDGAILGIRTVEMADGGYVRTFQDISARKTNERELTEARDAAEAASKARSEFLALMSHEIRTPMNAVMGLTDALAETTLDQDQQKLVNSVSVASRNLLQILNDVLDFSKLQAGRLQLEDIAFAPKTIIDEAVSILDGPAKAKGLKLTKGDIDLPEALKGDPGRLRQVLLNLISNAVKFTPTGAVTVSARQIGLEGDLVTFEIDVKDTGIGIPQDRLAKLFQDFVQVDNSISRRFGGTGLGLAISRRIIRQMQGDIRVASTEGVGSVFTVRVSQPAVHRDTIARTAGETDASGLEASLKQLGRPLRLLLAEDNAMNQFVFGRVLKALDIQITVAENGLKAVEAAQSAPFDAIFMDMRMPELDGLSATRAIRALGGALTSLPIIALTANAFTEDIKACRDAGMDDFLAKPIVKRRLFEIIKRLAQSITTQDAIDRLLIDDDGPSEEASDQPVFDRAILQDLREAIGEDGVIETVEIFLDDNRSRIARLQNFSVDTDRNMIEIESHSLKGAARAVGFLQLAGLGALMEQKAATLTADAYRTLMAETLEAFQDAERMAHQAGLAQAA
jgi:signal transduction histidine kinase/DNA-binding response OmpR family regulator